MKPFQSLGVLLLLHTTSSCLVQSTPAPGPQGEKGEPGTNGKDIAPDEKLAAMQAQIDQLEAKVSALSQEANPNCPAGYSVAPDSSPDFLTNAVVCIRGLDEVVKVGTGNSAFWIDRYEASMWTAPDGPKNGTQAFALKDDSE